MRGVFEGVATPAPAAAPSPFAPRMPTDTELVGHGGRVGRVYGHQAEPDPLARLPDAARAKMASLVQVQEEIGAVARDLSERKINSDRFVRDLAQRLELHKKASRRSPGAEAMLARDHTGAVAESAALSERLDRANCRRSRLPEAIMAALRTLPADIVLEMYDRPIAATLGKGESAPQAVERIRQRLLELKADLHTIASAPIPSSIAVARMKQQIAALADRGRPSVLNCAELGSEVEFAKTSVQHSGMPGWHETHEVLPLIAWLFQADLEQALEEEIREIADDASALDDDERLKRERAVLASILETERIEERLIEASEAEVARRADADFRAVLGLAALPAPAR